MSKEGKKPRDDEITDSDTEDELRLDEGTQTPSHQGEEDASSSDVDQNIKQNDLEDKLLTSPKPKIDEDAKAFLEFTNIVSESANALISNGGSSSIFFINTSASSSGHTSPSSGFRNQAPPPPPPDMDLPSQAFENRTTNSAHDTTSDRAPGPPSTMIIPVPYKTPQKNNEGRSEEENSSKQKIKRNSKQKKSNGEQQKESTPRSANRKTKTFKDETLKASGMSNFDDPNSKKRRGRPPGAKKESTKSTPTKKLKDDIVVDPNRSSRPSTSQEQFGGVNGE